MCSLLTSSEHVVMDEVYYWNLAGGRACIGLDFTLPVSILGAVLIYVAFSSIHICILL